MKATLATLLILALGDALPMWNVDEVSAAAFDQDFNPRFALQAVDLDNYVLDPSFEVEHSDTQFLFQPLALFEDHIILTNTGPEEDVYAISLDPEAPEGWYTSICQGGICYPPGTIVIDTLGAGEADSTIIAEIVTDSMDTTGYVTVQIQSQTDTNLIHTQRIWVICSDVEEGPGPVGPMGPLALSAAPNPARDRVRFWMHVPENAPISLRIYDPSGRLVRTFGLGARSPGLSELTWDLSNAEPGVYFCELRAGAERAVRKVIVSK
jgi:hypothetical protein